MNNIHQIIQIAARLRTISAADLSGMPDAAISTIIHHVEENLAGVTWLEILGHPAAAAVQEALGNLWAAASTVATLRRAGLASGPAEDLLDEALG